MNKSILSLLLMVVAMLAVRLLLTGVLFYQKNMDIAQFVTARDGEQFIAYVQAILDSSKAGSTDAFTLRLFPGYPLLVVLAHVLGLTMPWAMLVAAWLPSLFVPPLAALVVRDHRVGWAMVFLPPTWVMNATIPATEQVVLLFTLLGLLAVGTRRFDEGGLSGQGGSWLSQLGGGVLWGFAGLSRPVACFAVLAWSLARFRQKQIRAAVLPAMVALVTVGLVLALQRYWFGSFVTVSGYVDSDAWGESGMLTWPFRSLIETPLQGGVPTWKLGYIGVHVVFAFVAAGLLVLPFVRAMKAGRGIELWLGPWAWGLLLFILCTGGPWGFHEFDRFLAPALPALLYPYRHILPSARRWWVWLILAPPLLGVAYVGLVKSF